VAVMMVVLGRPGLGGDSGGISMVVRVVVHGLGLGWSWGGIDLCVSATYT
jgi:hypothetical protein